MNENLPPLKRGATLSLAGTVDLPDGIWSASCQVRTDKGVLVAQLEVVLTPPDRMSTTGLYTILIIGSSLQTTDWPIAPLQADVRFVDASYPPVVMPSESFLITVERGVTYA